MMLASRPKTNGFTLIELIVVLVIMGTLLSLVGPLAVRNVDKMNVRTEEMQFKNWLDKVSYTAFNRGQPLLVSLEGRIASANIVGEKEVIVDEIQFASLFFQPQMIALNKNGFYSKTQATYQLGAERYAIELSFVGSAE
ncbi:type II secretion system protein [Shewanella sp. Scap07]|uniref:pilus assembly FimT family protein n=1 Tax=Shewanella sp. Scap07 TaxID=2589987 RepID=UPI0015BEB106|nr:type II secretion system protein [Shewanella sp. Scap07]QLE86114.1 type II secretion system protein [Shewanella sp. Scap07]